MSCNGIMQSINPVHSGVLLLTSILNSVHVYAEIGKILYDFATVNYDDIMR